jgi:predicted DNA-binding transcriptional regulator YafY
MDTHHVRSFAVPHLEQALMRLAMVLQGSRIGLSLEELRTEIGRIKGGRPVTRVTVRKYRDDLHRLFGEQYLEEVGQDGVLRCRLVAAATNRLISLPAEDFAELHSAIAEATAAGLDERARRLRNVAEQLQSLVPRETRRALAIDLPDLLAAEGYALRPGPRPRVSPETLGKIREAMLGFRIIKIRYRARRNGSVSTQYVKPHGLIFGNRHYLVAYGTTPEKPFAHNYALGNIQDVEITDKVFERNADFDISTYAANSFGIWQEEPSQVILRFDKNRADDVAEFFFHPTQTMTTLDDGRVEVRFNAGGRKEIAWHLFTWSPDVEIVAPERLKDDYRKMLGEALARLC